MLCVELGGMGRMIGAIALATILGKGSRKLLARSRGVLGFEARSVKARKEEREIRPTRLEILVFQCAPSARLRLPIR